MVVQLIPNCILNATPNQDAHKNSSLSVLAVCASPNTVCIRITAQWGWFSSAPSSAVMKRPCSPSTVGVASERKRDEMSSQEILNETHTFHAERFTVVGTDDPRDSLRRRGWLTYFALRREFVLKLDSPVDSSESVGSIFRLNLSTY